MKKKMTTKMIGVLLTSAMAASMIVGCGGGSESTTQAGDKATAKAHTEAETGAGTDTDLTFGLTPFEETQKIRIGFLQGAVNPYIFAEKMGVFDALNIDAEFICFSGGPGAMEANSEWDIATCGAGGLCIGTTAYDMRMIDIMCYEEHHGLYARPDTPLAQNPSNPENWKCEWVYPAGTTCQAVLAVGLQERGLSMSDITSVNVDLPTVYTAFNSGTGDAMSVNPLQATYAEEAGYVLVGSDMSLGFTTPSGTVASKKILDSNAELVTITVAISHLMNDWIYSSEENQKQAARWFYENCQEEGYKCTEEMANKLTEWYNGPTTAEWFAIFNETTPDSEGKYTSRELLKAENDFLDPLDFFISEGKYTEEDRNNILDKRLVDNSVANAAKALLDEAGVKY